MKEKGPRILGIKEGASSTEGVLMSLLQCPCGPLHELDTVSGLRVGLLAGFTSPTLLGHQHLVKDSPVATSRRSVSH